MAVAVVSVLTFAIAPSPYVIEQPGPAYNTLGTVSISGTDTPVISVTGAPTYEASGALNLLTVTIVGNPDSRLSWLEAGMAWFDANKKLLPMDAIFPPGQSVDEQTKVNQAQMTNSQQDAVAAALLNMGYPVQRLVTVQGFADNSPADGPLAIGDVIVDANGTPVETVAELKSVINSLAGAPVPLTVERLGQTRHEVITPIQTDDGTWVIGIGATVAYTFPFDVKIQLDNVGGPSAGMMFSLGIIAKLTPTGNLTGGEIWAGTGTIDSDGNVGAIGGIQEKMVSAKNSGAKYMLAPELNCDQVTGHIPSGLEVFAVSTLSEARTAVETVAAHGDIAQLGRCPAS